MIQLGGVIIGLYVLYKLFDNDRTKTNMRDGEVASRPQGWMWFVVFLLLLVLWATGGNPGAYL